MKIEKKGKRKRWDFSVGWALESQRRAYGVKTEKPGLPEGTDNIRDSGQPFSFGTVSSGEG